METTIDINEAAAVIIDADKAALSAFLEQLTALSEGIDNLLATLPESISLESKRILTGVKGDIAYRISSELPMALAKYDPTANVPPAYVPPPYNPNA